MMSRCWKTITWPSHLNCCRRLVATFYRTCLWNSGRHCDVWSSAWSVLFHTRCSSTVYSINSVNGILYKSLNNSFLFHHKLKHRYCRQFCEVREDHNIMLASWPQWIVCFRTLTRGWLESSWSWYSHPCISFWDVQADFFKSGCGWLIQCVSKKTSRTFLAITRESIVRFSKYLAHV